LYAFPIPSSEPEADPWAAARLEDVTTIEANAVGVLQDSMAGLSCKRAVAKVSAISSEAGMGKEYQRATLLRRICEIFYAADWDGVTAVKNC
jgi:hypothetical protein